MRSHIDPRLLEGSARAVLFACLLALIWSAWSPRSAAREESVTAGGLAAALPRWTAGVPPARISVRLERIPTPVERDWLAALARAGSRVTWSGDLGTTAIEALTSAEPQHDYVIRAAATPGAEMVISDGSRELAAVTATGSGSSVRTTVLSGPVSVHAARGHAFTGAPVARRVGRAAVMGPAGWETKFVIAALEERGWEVDSRVTVGPGVIVGVLAPGALDTSRYAAVVVQELPAGWAQHVIRFVEGGGGLIVTGEAIRDRSLAAFLPAQPGRAFAARDSTVVRREDLGGVALAPGPLAAVLETRGDAPVVVAGRVGNGRVLLTGYADTWHWRMRGDERALEAHRDWWSAVVGATAYAPDTAAMVRSPESAPLAALHAAMGPPGINPAPALLSSPRLPIEILLFALATLALVGEIVSRRRRGLP